MTNKEQAARKMSKDNPKRAKTMAKHHQSAPTVIGPVNEFQARQMNRKNPTCTFCGEIQHNKSSCPKRSQFCSQGSELISADAKRGFIDHAQKHMIIQDPVKLQNGIPINAFNQENENIRHVFVHGAYANIKRPYYHELAMGDMSFEVSFIGKAGTLLPGKERLVIHGRELETFLHSVMKSQHRFIYDGTKTGGMNPDSHQRHVRANPSVNQMSQVAVGLSQQSAETYANVRIHPSNSHATMVIRQHIPTMSNPPSNGHVFYPFHGASYLPTMPYMAMPSQVAQLQVPPPALGYYDCEDKPYAEDIDGADI